MQLRSPTRPREPLSGAGYRGYLWVAHERRGTLPDCHYGEHGRMAEHQQLPNTIFDDMASSSVTWKKQAKLTYTVEGQAPWKL